MVEARALLRGFFGLNLDLSLSLSSEERILAEGYPKVNAQVAYPTLPYLSCYDGNKSYTGLRIA